MSARRWQYGQSSIAAAIGASVGCAAPPGWGDTQTTCHGKPPPTTPAHVRARLGATAAMAMAHSSRSSIQRWLRADVDMAELWPALIKRG